MFYNVKKVNKIQLHKENSQVQCFLYINVCLEIYKLAYDLADIRYKI